MAAFLENIILGKHYMGIEIFSINNEDRIALLEVNRKKNELVISKKGLITKIEELEEQKNKLPLSLVINNINVLSKETDSSDANDKKLVHKTFPNINLEEFYYEIMRLENRSVIAICRKSYINELLGRLEKNFRIISISLGLSSLSQIRAFSLPDLISTNTQTINFSTPELPLINPFKGNQDFNINGLAIPNTHLLAFSSILKILIKNQANTGTINEVSLNFEQGYKQKTFFSKGVKAGIIIVLALLLINFFVFTYYFKKAGELKENASLNRAGIENIIKLKDRVKEKEETLKEFTSQSFSKSSLMINELVQSIPSSILLTEINYYPLEKKIKEDEPILFEDKLISITGSTLSNEAFTNWVEQIEKLDWIDKVTIISFGKNTENITAFEIIIDIL